MTDLLSGGAVGAGMGELVKYAIQTINSGLQFGSTLKTSNETLNVLALYVEKMKGYNDLLDRPKEEIGRLEALVREGEELVGKSKKLTWKNFYFFPGYQGKLKKQDAKLERHLNVNVQVENKNDLMELRVKVDEMYKILKIVNRMVSLGQFDGKQIRGLCGAPEEPGFIGMDEPAPLNNLKVKLMKDGVSVLTVSEFELTTLDNMLCRDPQIRGKFGRNIFYVRLSRTPNLKNIVQTIIDSCGFWVPEFQNEDAIDILGLLFREIGFPILLLLDEKFKFQLPDYKILYTGET
ncbi:putative powdery mildew resistance protein, RPW8 [Medicago truncatula]|uniref:Putative powdery mildew resistance protein, RPW8 n=1 Tax=Medicago truncatula TaxID=3880 RepID=A0A396HND7_MEDTR|nr:probable disease resistance protein At5g66900 [Medicago truncatula]RHN54078.1 putative powdery mildew resistance protein, RPW8 [Medicago truncatula]